MFEFANNISRFYVLGLLRASEARELDLHVIIIKMVLFYLFILDLHVYYKIFYSGVLSRASS